MSLTDLSFRISSRQTQSRPDVNLEYKNSVTGRSNKNYESDKMESQNFVRSRSKDHEPRNLKFQNVTCGRQPPQTLQNEVPKFHPRQAQSGVSDDILSIYRREPSGKLISLSGVFLQLYKLLELQRLPPS